MSSISSSAVDCNCTTFSWSQNCFAPDKDLRDRNVLLQSTLPHEMLNITTATSHRRFKFLVSFTRCTLQLPMRLLYWNGGATSALHHWNSREAQLFQHSNHTSECSVKFVNGTRNFKSLTDVLYTRCTAPHNSPPLPSPPLPSPPFPSPPPHHNP